MWIARKLLKFDVPFVAPPNIVLGREIVPELLQEAATPVGIFQQALDILTNPERRQRILENYHQLKNALGETGVCDRAALEIVNFMETQTKK
jgi:lipid-A-disaccharide synthase